MMKVATQTGIATIKMRMELKGIPHEQKNEHLISIKISKCLWADLMIIKTDLNRIEYYVIRIIHIGSQKVSKSLKMKLMAEKRLKKILGEIK